MLFFKLVTTFGSDKIDTQKIKNNFFCQDKFYSLKAHAHYFTVFIYLATWRAPTLGIFTYSIFTNLPWCSQSMNSLIYIYSIQIPSCFLWVLDFLCTTAAQKKILYYPLPTICRFFSRKEKDCSLDCKENLRTQTLWYKVGWTLERENLTSIMIC